MTTLIGFFGNLMLAIEKGLRTIAAACLLAVMLVIFCDVFARYVFNAPLIWTYDLVGMYLMPALFYFAVSDTLAVDHHIAVDLLQPWIAPRIRRLIEALSSGIMAAIFCWIAWIFAQSSLANYRGNSVVMGSYEWPTWIPEFVVVIGSTAIALRLAGRLIGHLASLLTGRDLIRLPGPTGA